MLSREQELEDEVELLKQQLSALTGSSQEIGILVSLGYGMTHRLAQILHILIQRSPAIVSRNALHTIFYGDRDDGGPEPKIFAVHITRLRGIIKRWHKVYGVDSSLRIDTVWNTGYRASPELVKWVRQLYQDGIPKEK